MTDYQRYTWEEILAEILAQGTPDEALVDEYATRLAQTRTVSIGPSRRL